MQRLLIANRGEIAVRIVRTAREIGFETVAVHSPEDTELAAEYGADLLVPLAGGGAASYLDFEDLIGIAVAQKCDTFHPGYGFLSESAELAEACAAAGLLFVGPRPSALELFGDKARSRALATELGIPVVAGIPGPATVEAARAFLDAQPADASILLKAVAGGGGRGIRQVGRDDDFAEAFARCQSEAARSFGSQGLFAERVVENARHIEIQIVADAEGRTSHLWDRECTLQRRYQKLIEVAPSPTLDASLREQLIEAAIALARAAEYTGIGTFEFLLGAGNEFFFMEANPRLQVEHTVTEEVMGVDLVEIQLGLAAGRSLKALDLAEPPPPRGFAIQLRVLAETLDPEGQPRPSGETISVFAAPMGPGIRLDTAFRTGLAAHPAYDSLLAKLIVSSPDAQYVRTVHRAKRALREFRIEGPRTNLDLLAALIDRPEFASNQLTTTFVGKHAEVLADDAARRADLRARDALAVAPTSNSATQPAISPTGLTSTDRLEPELCLGADAIRAPLIATVLEICVADGEGIGAAQPIFVLESMKMEHVVVSESAGQIAGLFVAVGDVVAEGAILAGLIGSGIDDRSEAAAVVRDLDAIRPDLAQVQARHRLLDDASRPDAVARRRSRGQRTARENLAGLCDEGSFIEYGALAVAAMRRVRPLDELQRKTPGDAIITGMATVNADLVGRENARCAILVVDATVLAGTQGFFHHQKIDRILELAERAGTPVVFFPEGGGGRPNDTDASDVFVAGLDITSFHAFARLSGKVPRVSVVSGFCFAGSAAFAGCADVIIATRNANLGMGGPAMIEGGGLGVFAPQDVGPMSVQEPNGVVDLLVENEEEAVEVAKRTLSYFQGPLGRWTSRDPRELRHVIPENRRRIYEIRRVIEGLCDVDSILELRRAYAVGMITALVRIEGRPMGLIANDPKHLGGAIDDIGAEKAARFLQLCDAFGLPVLSLCDTPGFMVGPEIERRAQVRKVSRLFVVGASLRVPIFCVILRKGYGLGAQAMAGGSFAAPFDIVAWPTGEIGGMGLEGAVRLGFKKELDALENEVEKTALFEKRVGRMYEKGKAMHAASQLEFDAVIDPAETRARIVRGLHAYGPISRSERAFVDTW